MNSNRIKKRATSSQLLKNRIELNKKHQNSDFKTWQYKVYKKITSRYLKNKNSLKIKILDVGSGDGLQVSHFLKIFKNVEIWCLDYSHNSLKSLRAKYKSKNIKIFKLDMNNLHKFIANRKLTNYFHIAHSSYALYYAKNQLRVLNTMNVSLLKGGFFIVSAPSEPHEMVNLIAKNYTIPSKILNTLKFFKDILLPYLKQKGKKLLIDKKINYLNFKKTNDFINFWKNTTYYNRKFEGQVINFLNKKKYLKFKKISCVAAAIRK